jgi:hypothetical protein
MMSQTDRKAERIVRFASALWHGDRGSRGGFEAYMVEAKQIVDALPGLDCEDVIELKRGGDDIRPGPTPRSSR